MRGNLAQLYFSTPQPCQIINSHLFVKKIDPRSENCFLGFVVPSRNRLVSTAYQKKPRGGN